MAEGGREGVIACMGGFLPRDGWVGRRWRCPRCPAMPGSCRGHQPSQCHTAVPAGWCGQAGAMGGSGVGGGWVAFVWLHCGTSRRRCQPVTIPRRPTYCDRPTFSPVPHPTLPPHKPVTLSAVRNRQGDSHSRSPPGGALTGVCGHSGDSATRVAAHSCCRNSYCRL